jgi:lysophospholipid acyltransferase (LPLAT)-like uncharacterized protein
MISHFSSFIATHILKIYLRTIRVYTPKAIPKGAILALWHKDLPASIKAFSYNSITVQISASKDGKIAHSLCRSMGYKTIAGSSSSLQASIRSLKKSIESDNSCGITLDGPKGPAGKCSAGALWLTRKTKAPLFLITATYSLSYRIKSWDRMHLPLPFSRVTVNLTPIEQPTVSAIEKLFFD